MKLNEIVNDIEPMVVTMLNVLLGKGETVELCWHLTKSKPLIYYGDITKVSWIEHAGEDYLCVMTEMKVGGSHEYLYHRDRLEEIADFKKIKGVHTLIITGDMS